MDDGEMAGATQRSGNNMTLHVGGNVFELGTKAGQGLR